MFCHKIHCAAGWDRRALKLCLKISLLRDKYCAWPMSGPLFSPGREGPALHAPGGWVARGYCSRLVSLSSSCQFFSISSLQLRKASSSRRMASASEGLVRITTMS